MTPYATIKLLDRPDLAPTPLPPERWTRARVAGLTTEEILSRLEALGLAVSPDWLRPSETGRVSAWDLGREWVARRPDLIQGFDEDLVSLAACELWKRWCPQTPSIEMWDDWRQEGYDLIQDKHDRVAGCKLWLEVWDYVRPHFRSDMTTCARANGVFPGSQWLLNWTQDLALELESAVRVEAGLVTRGLSYLQDVLDQFTEEDLQYRGLFQESIGRLHLQTGQGEQAERVFRQILQDYPQSARGYVLLAEAWMVSCKPASAENHRRAKDILRQALDYPVTDAAEYDVKARLQELADDMPDKSTP